MIFLLSIKFFFSRNLTSLAVLKEWCLTLIINNVKIQVRFPTVPAGMNVPRTQNVQPIATQTVLVLLHK